MQMSKDRWEAYGLQIGRKIKPKISQKEKDGSQSCRQRLSLTAAIAGNITDRYWTETPRGGASTQDHHFTNTPTPNQTRSQRHQQKKATKPTT